MTGQRADGTARRLFIFEGGGEKSLKTLFDPWAPDCGEVTYVPYYFYAIEHPRGWVLVDCGAHPDLAHDPAARLGEQAAFSDVVMSEEAGVAEQLTRKLGVTADAVTDVVLTHLHYDHCGGLAQLPRATVHVQRAEMEFASDPPVYQRAAYIPADWAATSRWAFHDGPHDVFGDGAITVFPTPGHTPGHQSVLVALPETNVILVGDAAYHPEKMAQRILPAYLWNPDALIASWELIEEVRRTNHAKLLFSHYPGPAGLGLAPRAYARTTGG